jgi:AmpD protein
MVDGWMQGIRACPSPNCSARPAGMPVDLLVIHNISLPPGQFGGRWIEDFFLNRLDWHAHDYFATLRDLRVSAHFLVRRDGEVVQFVSCLERAWHAGKSSHLGRVDCNDFSIGVELEGTDHTSFEDAQYRSLQMLTRTLLHHLPDLSWDRIVGHSDIAPGRKTDPGPGFDWTRYLSARSVGPA